MPSSDNVLLYAFMGIFIFVCMTGIILFWIGVGPFAPYEQENPRTWEGGPANAWLTAEMDYTPQYSSDSRVPIIQEIYILFPPQ